jgi:hypothetical protein
LLEKFPILEKTAFLLIGFVGCILLVELIAQMLHLPLHIGPYWKFIGIAVIVSLTISYDRSPTAKTVLRPVVAVGRPLLTALDVAFGLLFLPITAPLNWLRARLSREPAN